MKLQFRGYYSIKAFRDAFDSVLDALLENEVDGLANINIYFRPHSDGCEISLQNREGQKVEHLVVDNPALNRRKTIKTKEALLRPYGHQPLDDAN